MTGFSALPIAEGGGTQDEGAHLVGVSKISGPRWIQLPNITIGLLGVQVLWSVEMSYGTPYLISLGLTKSAVAMVFLAGPISGLVVQPLIGVLADNSKSRFGRRRPYMLGGVLVCACAILLLGFTRPFATIFTTSRTVANDILTIWLAILAIFTVDFSINAVQAVDRALLVDVLPPSDQPDGNAWAAMMLGIGSVAGYFIGNVDMTKVLPFLGNTELEVLSVVGAVTLTLTHLAMALCVKEKVVVSAHAAKRGLLREFKEIWDNAKSLPPTIRQICLIQFCAWIGWFPVLFNTTEFIAELHRRAHPELDAAAALEEGTRLGSRALFYSSILSLVANIILPFFVAEAASRKEMQQSLSAAPSSVWVRWFNKIKVHLASLWAVSHLVFAVCMVATFFYSGVWGATFFTTLTGFPWAITQWAPFALLAEAILLGDEDEDASSILLDDTRSRRIPSGDGQEHERQFLVGNGDEDEEEALEDEVRSFRSSASMEADSEQAKGGYGNIMNNSIARMSHLDVHGSEGEGSRNDSTVVEGKRAHEGSLAGKAGIILGIHNIFIVIPQFLITGISSIVFAVASAGDKPGRGTEGQNSTMPALETREGASIGGGGPGAYAFIFQLGGVAAAVAFILTVKLARHLKHHA